ncbi:MULTISPECIES: nucleoside triphosphate pyrophosphohydrolase [unclassified Treponema]|uniref:nucleoside triphosphate pyrophosphohydrolase n=1 Tax=unclassified Treponema TaxID=2638727 RepID=UPI0020A34BF2|nr:MULTISPECIES: nucleoside triphosphate pyrophosphohydrolase [unclassified Treponema]UTC66064.1 nucleoside triphosphate pyrophosphohydrolase [Treponema sp. OMZ 789]UTC68794.1 nucleoside triphosphate pyrophosphohydrolase [Treponema sp. OMZ 790]UTC73927.1 nucleoside triphosphate pyrophosphohydrolase [Treponema sp. OMZ 791]
MENSQLIESFEALFNVIKRLRGPGGCPWDIAQNPMSMRRPLLEEAYEAADAIEEHKTSGKDAEHVKEELGDVLLNALMISYMYEQEGLFSAADVMKNLTEKLIRRHPHVFGKTEGYEGPESDKKASTPESVLNQWENIKEKIEKPKAESILDSIPKNFPPMLRALKISKKAAKAGFEWNKIGGIIEKMKEETAEFAEAVKSGSQAAMEDEIGDIFFVSVNAARFLKIDPEMALMHANKKFERRFRFVESEMKKNGFDLLPENSEKMEEFWNKAKLEERAKN